MKKVMVLLLVMIIMITGCSKKEKEVVYSNGEKVNTAKMGHIKCSREASGGTGVNVNLSYDLYYLGDVLTILHSVEQVSTTNEDTLDQYEEAYKKIYSHYEGLEYYDANVERGDTTVTSDVVINYDKIDINQILQIEGEEDNIIEDGEAKVSKWMTLAKKFGTKCEEVEE